MNRDGTAKAEIAATTAGPAGKGGTAPGGGARRPSTRVRAVGLLGAMVGYGCLAAFLCLVGFQVYRWLRDDEWTHFGVNEGLRVGLSRCCVRDADTGWLSGLIHWLDAPVNWLGLHKLLEVLPASLALFAVSILGNSIFIYCRDRSGDSKGS